LAGFEVYETRRPTSNESFEIQEWNGGGVLGGYSGVDDGEAFPKPLKGMERKANEERGEMSKMITDKDLQEAIFSQ